MYKNILLTLAIISSIGLFTTNAHADDAYIKMDEQLKKVLIENKDASSMMRIHNFVSKSDERIDIYRIDGEKGSQFIPQDKMSLLLYNTFIEKEFLPIIGILETNKLYLESQRDKK